MTATVWTNQTINSTYYTAHATNSVYDSADTWDGAELSATDTDATYDGYFPQGPMTWTPQAENSTVWT